MSKQNILLITQNFYPEIGSAGNRMKNIFQLLKEDEYKVKVLTTEPTYPNRQIYANEHFWDDSLLNEDSSVHRIAVRNRKYSLSMFNRLLYYLEVALKMIFYILFDRKKYDVIFVSSPPIFIGFVGLFAKYRYRTKIILDIRDLWPESLKGVGVFNYKSVIWMFTKLEVLLYNHADYIVVNSKGFINHIQHIVKNESKIIQFIPNAARLHEVPVEKKRDEDEAFKVIYTGNIGLAQDADFLKELALKLNELEIHLNIVGYGMRRSELKEFVKTNKLQYVKFFTPVKRKDCLELNLEHDVGIISLNAKEVFDTVLPGKLIDYMSTGLPVVAAVSGHSKKIIEEYETGFVSESRDVNEIIEYVLVLKNNPAIKRRMGKNSLDLIKSQFLWEENIYSLVEIIEDKINEEKPVVFPFKSKIDKVENNG